MKNDERLSQLLTSWTVQPEPEPDFQRAVWARIERRQSWQLTDLFPRLRDWIVLKLPRPAYATACIAFFVLTGLGVAGVVSDRRELHERAALKERYLTSIDPVAMAGQQRQHP